ncbi:MAG: phosphatidylglycerol lysyltransferase domain-containing protein [Chlamydiales bacterium]|nr:phosphatidylglycerol lysyltransferase domain-containing protein [Chlamydiales bacterium]
MEREKVVQLLRRFGGAGTDAILEPTSLIFTTPEVDGLIGYRSELKCFVVYGDPVCASEDMLKLVLAFHHYCKSHHKHIIYVSASYSFATLAMSHVCKALIKFGEELSYDPSNDPQKHEGSHGRLVRRKVHHAINEGTKVYEYLGDDKQLEKDIKDVAIAWLKNRKGPQVHTAQVRFFEDPFGKRWFYAKKGNELVGAVMLSRLDAHNGYLLTNLVMTPEAPHGTAELLIVSVFDILRSEGCHFVVSGSAPTKSLNEIKGFGKLFSCLIRGVYCIVNKLFHLGGHKVFWEKFCPKEESTYLLFSHPSIGIRDAVSLMRALNVSL